MMNKRIAHLFKILGDASYAIHLFGPLITIVITANNIPSKVLIILTTIAISIALNQIIENNFLKWSRKILYKRLEIYHRH